MPNNCHFYGIQSKVIQVIYSSTKISIPNIKTRDLLLNAFWDIRALSSNFGKRPLAKTGKNDGLSVKIVKN